MWGRHRSLYATHVWHHHEIIAPRVHVQFTVKLHRKSPCWDKENTGIRVVSVTTCAFQGSTSHRCTTTTLTSSSTAATKADGDGHHDNSLSSSTISLLNRAQRGLHVDQ